MLSNIINKFKKKINLNLKFIQDIMFINRVIHFDQHWFLKCLWNDKVEAGNLFLYIKITMTVDCWLLFMKIQREYVSIFNTVNTMIICYLTEILLKEALNTITVHCPLIFLKSTINI